MDNKEYKNAVKTLIGGFTLIFMMCWLYYITMWLFCS